MFERKWFWSSLIFTITGIYSFFIFDNLIMLAVFEVFLVYYGSVIYKSLTRQEMEWKGIIIDPTTDKEVFGRWQ